jgi:3-oxoacyl-[acyl-carrier-protein] synthase-3
MKIIGTGSAVPSLTVTNQMLSEILDTSDEWISSRTGIKQRRIITEESLTKLAVRASLAALEVAHLQAENLDYILCSNVINNYVTPSLSCILQGEIKAKCPTLDLNAACTGFIYALDVAESLISSGRAENILIVCAEVPSRMVDWKDRSNCVLFGDGAGAVVVSKGNAFKAFCISTQSQTDALYYQRKMEDNPYNTQSDMNAPMVMKGRDVFKLAVSSSVKDILNVLDKAAVSIDTVRYFLLHQANIRIIETIRAHLQQSEEKFPHNIEKYGNTSSASIPILLDELYRDGKLNIGNCLLFSAFGAGFTTGACILEWTI